MPVIDNMLTDPAAQAEIIARVLAANLGDAPARAAHPLGSITLADTTTRAVFIRHAADAVITDDAGRVVLITRRHNPGIGKLALPGGFLDQADGRIESPRHAALREAVEETGIDAALLHAARGLGPRHYSRPFDIRAAWNDIAGTGIKRGDLFAVSTQGFCSRLPSLAAVALTAGDDAAAVQVLDIATLTPAQFAVPDHLPMIREAIKLAK